MIDLWLVRGSFEPAGFSLLRAPHDDQVAADSAMEQIATALSEASLRKGETEQLKEDLAVNEKATQGRKGDIEQVQRACGTRAMLQCVGKSSYLFHVMEVRCRGFRRFSLSVWCSVSESAIVSHGRRILHSA